jgi:hypothetical protein
MDKLNDITLAFELTFMIRTVKVKVRGAGDARFRLLFYKTNIGLRHSYFTTKYTSPNQIQEN